MIRLGLLGLVLLAPTGEALAHVGSGLVVTPDGVVYFLPHWSLEQTHRIGRVSADGKLDDLVVDARIEERHDLFLRPDGSLWTAARGRVWRVEPTGRITLVHPRGDAEVDARGPGGGGGDPFAVAPDGTIAYAVADQERPPRIVRIAPDGAPALLAGGERGFRGAGGGAVAMGSLHTSRLAFGPDGRTLFVTDGTQIRTVAPDGAVATLAGAAEAGEADGDRESARFRFVGAMAFDAAGGLLVTDANRIRRVTREGAVTTLRGPADPETGERPPLVFDRPTGVAVGPKGAVHVLDRDGLRVSRVDGKGRVETLAELPRK